MIVDLPTVTVEHAVRLNLPGVRLAVSAKELGPTWGEPRPPVSGIRYEMHRLVDQVCDRLDD